MRRTERAEGEEEGVRGAPLLRRGIVDGGDFEIINQRRLAMFAEGSDRLPGVLPDSSPEMPARALSDGSNRLPVKWRT